MGVFDGVELTDLELTGERLTLRRWRSDDADVVVEAMQDRALHEFLLLPDPYTRADAEAWVGGVGDEGRATGTGIGCAVVETATGRLVGAATLRLPGPRATAAEIGYWMAPWGRGNGHAAEASRMLAGWACQHGVARVEIRCAVGNLASAKTALAAGFQFEAVLRHKELTPRGPMDGALFARLPGDADEPVVAGLPALPTEGLTDGVITLRVIRPDDTDAALDELNNPEAIHWGFSATPTSRETVAAMTGRAALEWLVGAQMKRLAIVDAASGEMGGTIALRLAGPPRVANIGYGVRPAFRGRGFTARALQLLSTWAFEQAGFVRLELGAKQDNIASQKAAVAGGFEPDGVRAARLPNADGSVSDEVCFVRVNPAATRC